MGVMITLSVLLRKLRIEIDILKRPIKQDQYIAAFGGLKAFRFCKDEQVEVLILKWKVAKRWF
jgi:galactokinase/mevalonate kinase-like predicted kinase